MKYSEWVKKNGHIDSVLRHILPPDEELEKLTRKELLEQFGEKITQAVEALGVELTAEELHEALDRVHGLPKLPEFHKSHYDFHC